MASMDCIIYTCVRIVNARNSYFGKIFLVCITIKIKTFFWCESDKTMQNSVWRYEARRETLIVINLGLYPPGGATACMTCGESQNIAETMVKIAVGVSHIFSVPKPLCRAEVQQGPHFEKCRKSKPFAINSVHCLLKALFSWFCSRPLLQDVYINGIQCYKFFVNPSRHFQKYCRYITVILKCITHHLKIVYL